MLAVLASALRQLGVPAEAFVDFGEAADHQHGDVAQGRRRREGGDRAGERREDEGGEEKQRDDDCRQTRPAADRSTGRRFDVSGRRRGAEHPRDQETRRARDHHRDRDEHDGFQDDALSPLAA